MSNEHSHNNNNDNNKKAYRNKRWKGNLETFNFYLTSIPDEIHIKIPIRTIISVI